MAPRFAFVPARWLAPDSGLTPTDRLTLCVLCQWVNRESGECFPSVATIAAHAALSENSVRTAIKRLQTVGAVEVIRRKDPHGDSASNLYTILGYDPPKKSVGGTSPVAVPPSAIEVGVPQQLKYGTANEPFEVPQQLHPNVVKETKEVDVPAASALGPEGPRSLRVALTDDAPAEMPDWRTALASVGVPERHLTKEGKFA